MREADAQNKKCNAYVELSCPRKGTINHVFWCGIAGTETYADPRLPCLSRALRSLRRFCFSTFRWILEEKYQFISRKVGRKDVVHNSHLPPSRLRSVHEVGCSCEILA